MEEIRVVEGEEGQAPPRQEHAGGHVGLQLQAARLDQGRELSEIAAQTRVPLRHLTALEEGRHETLPALPYTIGFVKAYARAVGLDPEEAARRFREETTLVAAEPSTTLLEPIDERRAPPKSAMLLGLLLVTLVILGGLAWGAGWFGGANDVAEPEFDPLTSEAEVATAIGTEEPELRAAATAEREEAAAAAAGAAALSGPVVVRADEEVWVRIRGGGETLLMRVMEEGETFDVPQGRDDLVLRTGRAGALTILVGGEELPKIGNLNEVVGDVPLTPAGLQRFTAGDAEAAEGE